MRWGTMIAGLAAAVLAAPAAGEEHRIGVRFEKGLAWGWKEKVTSEVRGTYPVTDEAVAQLVLRQEQDGEYRETVLEAQGGRRTRVLRRFDRLVLRVRLGGDRESNQVHPLQGKEVTLAEGPDGRAAIVSPRELAAHLPPGARLADKFDLPFPDAPVPVGHRWTGSPADLGRLFGLEPRGGKLEACFQAVVTHKGQRAARVEVKIEFTGYSPETRGTTTLALAGPLFVSLAERLPIELSWTGTVRNHVPAKKVDLAGTMTVTGSGEKKK